MKKISPKKFVMAASTLLILVTASSISLAQAQWQQQCQQQCQPPSAAQLYRANYDANVHWPKIFIPPARRSVCSTYDAMINNGWRRQNLLGNYHFNQDTNQLTDAGKLKVNWILSQAPQHRRSVFVQRGAEQLQTTARIAAVHEHTAGLSPAIGAVNVNDTHIVAEGNLASSVDSVFVGYEANRLPPVLPASTGGGGSPGQ